MYRRTMGMVATAIALLMNEATSHQGAQMISEIKYANRKKANHGTPSGAARAKRIARKRKNIRARSAK